jgi:hypothetical protein
MGESRSVVRGPGGSEQFRRRGVRFPGQLVAAGMAINQVWGRVCWEAMLEACMTAVL